MNAAQANTLWAWTLIDALAASGVSQAVISPGSRSTPLALACLRHAGIKTHVVVDERSAGFFALGLAKSSRRPVTLVCTSGSALANWFPAVVEANLGAVPLILLSADRPPELQACGANQTMDQNHFFGAHGRAFHALPAADASPSMLVWLQHLVARAVDQSRWPLAGPVHINVPLREPLVEVGTQSIYPSAPVCETVYPVMQLADSETKRLAQALAGKCGLIVCGEGEQDVGFAAALTALATQIGCPVLADPLSGLRFGAHVGAAIMVRYDTFLRAAAMPRPDWIMRFGAMPVSKPLQTYLDGLADTPLYLVDAGGRWLDPQHRASQVVRASATALCQGLSHHLDVAAPAEWLKRFEEAEHDAAELAEAKPPLEAVVVRAILDSLPEGGNLFSGNSMAIRDLDAFSGKGRKHLHIFCNRGASGIDGNLSTALGIAAGSGRASIALLGDLALFHDLNALVLASKLDIVLVVINNGGGGIFEYLPQAGLEEFEQGWLTPQNTDFSHAAAMAGVNYCRVDDVRPFFDTLAAATRGGAHLIEVVVDRADSVRRHQAYWQVASMR
ncbi:MAG: 2-succinyl-5-enolpyruvyl-6-hydroxy-3-cyclohexene-1-carboxylic-acid synthase [Sulfuricellaceae bacterium]|nr:2-succinyl-5-enolpyruvyl-6-hydroxy-3-cyclohexene-1-carboxylic-acid synthase [Sulfuricellaceae bacterium]